MTRLIVAVINTTYAVVKLKLEKKKKFRPDCIRAHDHWDTDALSALLTVFTYPQPYSHSFCQ